MCSGSAGDEDSRRAAIQHALRDAAQQQVAHAAGAPRTDCHNMRAGGGRRGKQVTQWFTGGDYQLHTPALVSEVSCSAFLCSPCRPDSFGIDAFDVGCHAGADTGGHEGLPRYAYPFHSGEQRHLPVPRRVQVGHECHRAPPALADASSPITILDTSVGRRLTTSTVNLARRTTARDTLPISSRRVAP